MRRIHVTKLLLLIAPSLLAWPLLGAPAVAGKPDPKEVEAVTSRLVSLSAEVEALGRRVEEARVTTGAAPPELREELARVRPLVRAEVSRLFGLDWRVVAPALSAAAEVERRLAHLEGQLKDAPVPRASLTTVASGSGAITGLVTDAATGSPLVGVKVRIYEVHAVATTDATGRWIVTGLATGTYRAYTEASSDYVNEVYRDLPCDSYCSGYDGTPIAVTDGAVTTGVDFALARAGGVSGRITDATSGAGVPGAWVYLYPSTGDGFSVRSASTSADGSFSFTRLVPGTYFLRTSSERYMDELWDGIPCEGGCTVTTGTPVVVASGAVTTGVDVDLQLGGSVSGTVTAAATGAQLYGYVTLYGPAGLTRSAYAYSGEFLFEGLPAGTYYAKAEASGYADQLWDGILCEPSCAPASGTPIVVTLGHETQGVDFSLVRLGSLGGGIREATTAFPLGGVSVRVYSSGGSLVDYEYSGETGEYRSAGLSAGTYYAVAVSPTHLDELFDDRARETSCDPTTGTAITVSLGSDVDSVDFELQRGGGITGRLTAAADGSPVSGAVVEVFDASGTKVTSVVSSVLGGYFVGDLRTGIYFVRVRSTVNQIGQLYDGIPCAASCLVTSGTPVAVTAGLATEGIDFSLEEAGSISGTVINALSGLPVAGLYVRVHDTSGAYLRYGTTDSQGRYKVTGLDAGSHFVLASASGFEPQLWNGIPCPSPCIVTAGTPVPVALSTNTSGIDFALAPYGSITGKITDVATGQPLTYTNVRISDSTGAFFAYGYTDGSGNYAVTGLPDGSYFVSTQTGDDYVDALWENLDCGAPCDVTRGTPVVVAVGTVSSGIDFALHRPYFADVGLGHWARRFVEGVYVGGVTAGCAAEPRRFCPDDTVSRWQLAVFLAPLMAKPAEVPFAGKVPSVGAYDCVAGGTSLFPNDVPPEDGGCRFIHYVYGKGLTAGCAPGSFCPGAGITRWQAAVFLAGAVAGGDENVPAAGVVPGVGSYDCVAGGTSLFPNDVPPEGGGCRHVHYIFAQGITSGCAPGSFCPSETLSRAQMAVFLSTGFGLTSYGP